MLMIVGLLSLCFNYGQSMSEGAPITACGDMFPSHGFPTQYTSPPYKITFEPPEYSPGQDIKVSLEKTTKLGFKGFLLMFRDSDDFITGSFKKHGEDEFNSVACDNPDDTVAITHVSSAVKKKVSFIWKAPDDASGPVTLKWTVVQEYGMYWVDQQITLNEAE
ncbi:unnamed protein product [Owenia fusiformis]|uniref:Uncharacterized protein n=1 Tax=Owenia fusiformis TaxID=6347 RepID=A0A8J1UGT9_OWEFU|nr:unnamed protein product [Owenia fusiformis]